MRTEPLNVYSPAQEIVSDVRRAAMLGKIDYFAGGERHRGRLGLLSRAHVFDFGFLHDRLSKPNGGSPVPVTKIIQLDQPIE